MRAATSASTTRWIALLFLAVGPTQEACHDSHGPSDQRGTLVVSTSTVGADAAPEGYLLTVDGVDSVALVLRGEARLSLSPGHHTVRLVDLPSLCSVAPAPVLEVDVGARDTTSVAFQISCALSGARITLTTSGLDIDPDGYRVLIDGADQGGITVDAKVLFRLDPGDRSIALTGLAPNCRIDGLDAYTVTLARGEIAPITFAVACTATSGVIAVLLEVSAGDTGGTYRALLDGQRSVFVEPLQPAYLTEVAPGEHVVSLAAPSNCSPTSPRPVTVTAGGLTRDTVVVGFTLECDSDFPGTIRITAPTRGIIPAQPFTVWICKVTYDCIFYGTWRPAGRLAPNGTLVIHVSPGRYQLHLRDVPTACRVRPSVLSREFTVDRAVDIEFHVSCPP